MNKKIFTILVALILALVIVLSTTLSLKINNLKATDEFMDEIIGEEVVEEIVEDPTGEFSVQTEETIFLDDIQEEPKRVEIYYDFNPNEVYYGMTVNILSNVSGYINPVYNWKYSLDGETWFDIDNSNSPIYSFILDETNQSYRWRLNVEEQKIIPEEIIIEEEIIPEETVINEEEIIIPEEEITIIEEIVEEEEIEWTE